MLYLAGQITWFMVLAALVGFAVGWLFRHWWGSRGHDEAVAGLERELETCRSLQRTSQERAAGLEKEIRTLQERLDELETTTGRTGELERDLEAARAKAADLEARTGEIDALRAGLLERDARISELETEVEAAAPAAEQIEELGVALDHKDALITELEQRLSAGGAGDAAARIAELEAELSAARLGEISQEAAAAQVQQRFAISDRIPSDDLTAIKGIGPKLERMLNEMGVRTFRQIARWDPDDIAMVSAALAAFPGRIVRDDWVGGARTEHLEAYGERL